MSLVDHRQRDEAIAENRPTAEVTPLRRHLWPHRPEEQPDGSGSGTWGKGPTAAVLAAVAALGLGGIALGTTAMLTRSTKPAAGAQGPAGPAGATGTQGASGAQGPQGLQGPAGAQGPAGPVGQTGATGPAGPPGPAGPEGRTGPRGPAGARGPAGPPGTVTGAATVARPLLTTAPDPAVGTALTATSSCPSGEVLVSGGAKVGAVPPANAGTGAANSTATPTSPAPGSGDVALESSYPLAKGGWRTVAVVTNTLPAGYSMTLHPYVLCGKG